MGQDCSMYTTLIALNKISTVIAQSLCMLNDTVTIKLMYSKQLKMKFYTVHAVLYIKTTDDTNLVICNYFQQKLFDLSDHTLL